MSRERPDLVAWGARLVAAAVDQGQHRGADWITSAERFLGAAKEQQRETELSRFVDEFSYGWRAAAQVHPDEPVPAQAVIADADLESCVHRIVGAAGARGSLLNALPTLAGEVEPFYTLSAALMQAMDEAGALGRPVELAEGYVRRIRLLERTLDEALRAFYEKGHPGYEAVRTSFLPVAKVARWRAILAGETPPGADDTAVLARVPDEPASERA
ncbi:MAG: hypothetical protein ABW067_17395 [Rhizobacter sp.]